MNFTVAEIEVLRLAGWYKALPQELECFESRLLSPAGTETLFAMKPLYRDVRDCLRLTTCGWDFLDRVGYDYPRDNYFVTDTTKHRRRKEAAQVSFIFYRAGFHVFADTPDALTVSSIYLSAAAARRSTVITGSKVWAGNCLAGIACRNNTAYMLHYLNGQGIFFSSEMKLFQNIAANHLHTACIYTADSYLQAASYLHAPQQEVLRGGCVSFFDAFEKTTMPVHLLECSSVGAMQLQIMSRPSYREQLAHLTLGNAFVPPPAALPGSDAMTEGCPMVVAVDMDIKRIKSTCLAAKEQGYKNTILILLPEQLDALGILFHPLGGVLCCTSGEATPDMAAYPL